MKSLAPPQGFSLGIAGELEQLAGADCLAKKQARGFGQLVGFVEDYPAAGGG